MLVAPGALSPADLAPPPWTFQMLAGRTDGRGGSERLRGRDGTVDQIEVRRGGSGFLPDLGGGGGRAGPRRFGFAFIGRT
jgi:hypothetical protein